jgi:hypothetical protein
LYQKIEHENLNIVVLVVVAIVVVAFITTTYRAAQVFNILIYIQGTLAMYELRAGKVQLLTAHTGPIIAVAFSSDGKNLATYSVSDNKLHFWQTSTGMFGLGNAQTKCTRWVRTLVERELYAAAVYHTRKE